MHRTAFLPLLLAACTGAEEGPHYADDDTGTPSTDTSAPEDADTPETARELAWETEESGTLDADDADWFKVTGVSAGQHFRVQVVNADENASEDSLDTVVEVYDSAMTRIAWEDDHPVGDVGTYDTVCFGFFPEAGSYFVRIVDKGTFEGAERDVEDTDYTVQILGPSGPPEEPDSLLRLANGAAMDNDNSWYALPVQADEAGDTDYVLLELAHSDGALTFARAHHIESSPYTPALTLYDSEGTPVLQADTVAETDFRQYISPPDSTYILGVSDTTGALGPAAGMWVFVANSEEGYGNSREREPNDSADGPMTLTLEDQYPDAGSWVADFVEGRIDPAGDQDWYTFTLTEDSYVAIAFGALNYGSLLEATVEVDGPGGHLTGTASGGTDPEVKSETKLAAGSYTVTVVASDGSTGGQGSFYRMAVHATSVPL